MQIKEITRKTKQEIMPLRVDKTNKSNSGYSLYPYHSLGGGKISVGYKSLADWLALQKVVKIDGEVGVDWENVVGRLSPFFAEKGLRVTWISTQHLLQTKQQNDALDSPTLSIKGRVLGKNTRLVLRDFYRL